MDPVVVELRLCKREFLSRSERESKKPTTFDSNCRETWIAETSHKQQGSYSLATAPTMLGWGHVRVRRKRRLQRTVSFEILSEREAIAIQFIDVIIIIINKNKTALHCSTPVVDFYYEATFPVLNIYLIKTRGGYYYRATTNRRMLKSRIYWSPHSSSRTSLKGGVCRKRWKNLVAHFTVPPSYTRELV